MKRQAFFTLGLSGLLFLSSEGSIARAVGEGGSPPDSVTVESEALERLLGSAGQGSQYTERIRELLAESEEAKSRKPAPAEPPGLLDHGLNRKVSGDVTFPLSEVAIAVSKRNSKLLAIGANASTPSGFRQAVFISHDRGRTFRSSQLPTTSPFAFLQSDPTLAWDEDGTLWAAAIEGLISQGLVLRGQTFTSVDEGATWTYAGSFSGTSRISDRPTIRVDDSRDSSFRGNRYIIWHNGAVFVSRRSPGATAWSEPVRVSPTDAHGFGGDLEIDSEGRIFAFWPDTNRKTIFVAVSEDGGALFGAPIAVAPIEKPFSTLSVPAAGRSPLNHVTTAILERHGRRRLFVAWYDPATPPASGARIWFAASSDAGATWSAPREVSPIAGAADQFHPAIAVDGHDGRLAVSFTDTSGDPGGLTTRRVAVTSNDYGATWRSVREISTERSDVLAAPAQIYGDYQGLVTNGERCWAAWTDRRTEAASSVWLAELRITGQGIVRVPIEDADDDEDDDDHGGGHGDD